MSYRKILWLIGLLMMVLVLAACSTSEPATETAEHEEEHAIHWDYEGEGGPEHWRKLEDGAYELCGIGVEQSPIDLTSPTMTDLENIAFDYGKMDVHILNNGHTIQVNHDEGSSIEINGRTYNLLQFHFHAPSEHAVNGTLYSAEMHLVHTDADGNLAVVGVFIAEGAENAAYTPVWDNLPSEKTEAIATGMSVNAVDLLPAEQVVYRYNGSLTTPPCSEGVLWSVMESPVEMSAQQITAFTDIFEGTNRPVQPLNDRDLQLDETP
ncbi:MAG: carbonic anhydrase family protein [Chloroflexi bacterium]|nr:carbonic anhydrase family protein [Chloroflexota bacterium]